MRVLLLCPMADGQTGPAWKYALEKLGHEVLEVDAKLVPQNSYSAALQFKPDLVFCSRTTALTAEVVKIKQAFENAVSCMWNVDTRNTVDKWAHLFPLVKAVDYNFIVGCNVLEGWRKLNAKTYWLSQGLQDEVYNKPREITEDDRRKYACDIYFAGRMAAGRHYPLRKPAIRAIRQEGFKANFWGCLNRPKIYNEEHNKQVALAKISLGCSGWPGAGGYTSVRDYKILGAGGFLLTNYKDKQERLYPCDGPSRVLDYYRDIPELISKIRHWLLHEEERREIAERGYKWVHENATYTHRMRMALDYMKEDLGCPN